jgi:hypothetical protein
LSTLKTLLWFLKVLLLWGGLVVLGVMIWNFVTTFQHR